MRCAICALPIRAGDEINNHHPHYRSNGGTATEPTHKTCHVALHSTRGDFREFGRIGGQVSALSRRWALNLKHVRNHPAHEINRAFFRAMYSH